MKRVGFVSVILTGYVAMTLGVLKIFWRQFSVHFYAPGIAHAPQADLATDITLILIILISGMSLVVFRAIVPALLLLIAAFFFEFSYLHDGPHNFWQYAFVIGTIVGQLITLLIYLIGYSDLGKTYYRHKPTGSSTGRLL